MEYITYNGQQLPTIKEGFWPDGITMIGVRLGDFIFSGVVCLMDGKVMLKDGTTSSYYKHWAILPPILPDKRLSNLEVANLCRQGWTVLDNEWVLTTLAYTLEDEDKPCENGIKIRKPLTKEWINPTEEGTNI